MPSTKGFCRQSFTIKPPQSWKVLVDYRSDKPYECSTDRAKWILAVALQWCMWTSWLIAVNSSNCWLFWATPAIFTFQKSDPHSCSQAAVTLGLLSGLCCLLHVCVCLTVAVGGSTVLRPPAQVFWGKQNWICLFKIAMCLVSISDFKSVKREITEDLWCDEITIFECQWFGAEMKAEATD